MLIKNRKKMKKSEFLRGLRAIDYLANGAPSHQKTELPPVQCKNSATAFEYGRVLTDTIAQWIVEGFVAGPFQSPPLPKFRSNPLKMVPQHDKVRPVLNVSSPAGYSFNDNVKENGPEKLFMSSARNFSYSILAAGRFSKMTKFDMQNAYKIVPCKVKDLRLQGFSWCGKFFVETTQVFGAKTAVANFDTIGNTILSLALTECTIPRYLTHRQLDDVPVVAPAGSSWCEEFTIKYQKICDELGVKLAPWCPNFDKAFANSTRGKVLGVEFDTSNLSWKLPEEKRADYMNDIHNILSTNLLDLEKCQSILGKLNFVCTMCPLMRSFKRTLYELMASLSDGSVSSVPLSEEARKDLTVWWIFLKENCNGYPISEEACSPPLQYKTITTDAAGWNLSSREGQIGMGCVGLDEDGIIFLASQWFWGDELSRSFHDSKKKLLGCKTTTLEFAGILIPFLTHPEMLVNQTVVIQVDNIGCHYAWENGYSNGDQTASILVRCLILISAMLSTRIHVHHHPRESSWESKLADRLSRARSTTSQDLCLLNSFEKRELTESFMSWMKNPVENWDLPMLLINELRNKL